MGTTTTIQNGYATSVSPTSKDRPDNDREGKPDVGKRTTYGLLIASLALSQPVWALDFGSIRFEIFRGDTNSDGRDDLYLKRKPNIVLISTSTTIPVAVDVAESHLMLAQSDGTFGSPTQDDTVDTSSLTEVTDISYGDFNGDGVGDLLVQAATTSQSNVLLYGSATSTPTLAAQFTEIDGHDLSANEGSLVMDDVDLDGFADLVFDPTSGDDITFDNLATGAFSFDLGRTTSYEYTTSGLLSKVKGPRTDITDDTTYTYKSFETGIDDELWKITNALNHVIEVVDRDGRGFPTEIKDANGVTTELEYTARGKLKTRTVKHPTTSSLDAVTEFDYNVTNLLRKITFPDDTHLIYEYDNAQRLIRIKTSFTKKPDGTTGTAERLVFTLDDASNRTREKYYDTTNTMVQLTKREFDELSRLHQIKDNDSPVNATTFDYDLANNQTEIKDALNQKTKPKYDNLNRVEEIENALNDSAFFKYDERGNITKVTDQRGLETTYKYDANDNLIEENNPDAGVTAYAYDLADNLTQIVDARGIVTNLSYDALNRLTDVLYPNTPDEDVTYAYDTGTYGKGRLSSITDESGSTTYTYDHRGNVTQDSRVVDGTTYTTDYEYTLADNISEITYPSGRVLTIERDDAGRVERIKEGSTTLIDNVKYHPFGRAIEWEYENGLTMAFSIDMDGRVEKRQLKDGATVVEDWDFNFDDVHNIDDIVKDAGTEDYAYDAVYRLKEQTPIGQSKITYTYDEVGNRETETQGATVKTNIYDTVSNRLEDEDGYEVTHDAAGNRITDTDGDREFTYNTAGRLIQVDSNSVTLANYLYNALGQRVQKDDGTDETDYVYDLNGQLIGEYDGGTMIREYVYLNGIPVIQFTGTTKTFLHPDHLGTPRSATNSSKTVVWEWGGEAFGSELPDEDPDNNSQDTVVNLRFLGQYYDSESGFHYNYFRDYEPALGRYVQSDPIGLAGGMNTYAYVHGNPLTSIDPFGLRSWENFSWASFSPTDPTTWPDAPQSVVDIAAGLGDSLLLTFGDDLRALVNLDQFVDRCSDAYKIGGYGAVLFGGGRLVYAAVAKGYSLVAPSGAAASAARSAFKNVFRLGGGRDWRQPDLSRYGTDDALRAAAGRTNPYANLYGAGIASSATSTVCGCTE